MLNYTTQPDAVSYIRGGKDAPGVRGTVKFYQRCEGVWVEIDVSGLPSQNESGFFALHIHEGRCCCGAEFADTGSHFNPTQAPHPRHAGDLPPLLSCRGKAHMQLLTDRFRVREVIGRTVVIHANADDFHTQPAGNAGEKIGCGVICRI